jgi:hypothetical protein
MPLLLFACDGTQGPGTFKPFDWGSTSPPPGDTAPDTAPPTDTPPDTDDTDHDTDSPSAEDTGPFDADGDGWNAGDDCDDADASAWPGAPEECDGADDDCDGEVDEGWDRIVDEVVDACGDGVDADGDGEDPVCPEQSVTAVADLAETVWTGESEDAYLALWGGKGQVGDYDGDGAEELCAAAYGTVVEGVTSGGAVYVIDPSETGEHAASEAQVAVYSDSEEAKLSSCAALPGDGRDLLAVGALEQGYDPAVYVLDVADGATANVAEARLVIQADFEHPGGQYFFGYALGSSGDLTGDGVVDLAVGDPLSELPELGNDGPVGDVFVFSGDATGTLTPEEATARLRSDGLRDLAGTRLDDAGDTDGDGQNELLVGGGYWLADEPDPGHAWLVSGPVEGTVALGEVGTTIDGVDDGDKFGWGASGLGDLDGDGYADIAVAAPGSDLGATDGGAVYLFYGPVTTASAACADAVFVATQDSSRVSAPATVADFDRDGVTELAVSAWNDQTAGNEAGAVFVFGGPFAGVVPFSSALAKLTGAEWGTLQAVVALDESGQLAFGSAAADGPLHNAGAIYLTSQGLSW